MNIGFLMGSYTSSGMDDLDAYRAMLEKSDLSELKGVLRMLDVEKFPDRYAVAESVYRRRAAEAALHPESPKDMAPTGRISRNWHLINAVLVGIMSLNASYSSFSVVDSLIYLDWSQLGFAVLGVLGVTVYFWKPIIGHYLILAWWIPQSVKIIYDGTGYGFYTGISLGIEWRLGSVEFSFNFLAIISAALLISYRKYYSKMMAERLRLAAA